MVRFPKRACPLRERCTRSRSGGRSVSVHPDEGLLGELRERQGTPAGRKKLRERVDVPRFWMTQTQVEKVPGSQPGPTGAVDLSATAAEISQSH